MQFKAFPFYSKAIIQNIFLKREKRVALARKAIEPFTREKEKAEKEYKFKAEFAKFAENLQFLGMVARMKVLNYLLNDGISQYQRKYVINKIAEYDMVNLAKQGFSKAANAIITTALDAKNDEDVKFLLHYPIFSLFEQEDLLGSKDYQAATIAACKFAPDTLLSVLRLGAYHEKG
ncbi:MAG: hypothetical protein NTX79_07370 [Candidatus Micrarchaeota archaeon]|nr:hypothetical protein [Candidatus Micrarchaeota archaeon]